MSFTNIRTDLALEARENLDQKDSQIHGIEVSEHHISDKDLHITTVRVTTKNAAKALGKPMGTYITMEAPAMDEDDEGIHREISIEVAALLKSLITDFDRELSVLIVGLGNREVTADSLGPRVIDQICITRHMVLTYGKAAYNKTHMHLVSSLAPGVMAQNGMETSEIIKGVIEQTKPDLAIVIDALAARTLHRLNRTIQITDTGIHPGSGVGNHRNALTRESLGIPVIAIGIPTVVDAATIVKDALSDFTRQQSEDLIAEFLSQEDCHSILQELNTMYVTGKDIDAIVKRLSFTISEALNITFDNKDNVGSEI